jgi:hypothetical protein
VAAVRVFDFAHARILWLVPVAVCGVLIAPIAFTDRPQQSGSASVARACLLCLYPAARARTGHRLHRVHRLEFCETIPMVRTGKQQGSLSSLGLSVADPDAGRRAEPEAAVKP